MSALEEQCDGTGMEPEYVSWLLQFRVGIGWSLCWKHLELCRVPLRAKVR